jgi:hypothetical protein
VFIHIIIYTAHPTIRNFLGKREILLTIVNGKWIFSLQEKKLLQLAASQWVHKIADKYLQIVTDGHAAIVATRPTFPYENVTGIKYRSPNYMYSNGSHFK